MKLFFLRHGIAQPARNDVRDWDRQLTDEGRAQLNTIGRALQRLGVKPEVILTSPLARAHQTAEIVAPLVGGNLQVAPELQPGCTLEQLQHLLRQYNVEAVMLVGHQPDLSLLAAQLIEAHDRSIVLKKGGLIRVDLDGRPQPSNGRLVGLLTPKMLTLMDERSNT
jgi:phosphohistidine phosphatase